MRDGETRPGPFSSPEARRLALLFAIVYFAQGMVYLPDQVVSIVFKERGLTAGQLATFTWVITIPWFIKPVYGLLSDFVPIAGTRRRSYFLIMAALATVSAIARSEEHTSELQSLRHLVCRLLLVNNILTSAYDS